MKKKGKSKLDLILKLQKKELGELRKEDRELKHLDKEEHLVSSLERKQLRKLEELKKIEEKVRIQVGEHPLRKITYKDVGKSMIGAFVGIVSHFTVLEGVHFAANVSFSRANFFLFISFLVGLVMIYYTGFRKVNDMRLFAILPFRLFLVYAVTIISILIALLVFGSGHFEQELVYRQVAVLSLPAIIGACAADLIGGD